MKPFDPASIPVSVATDSYKQTHPFMIDDAAQMSAYIEARRPFERGEDTRIVHFGVRYFVERWLLRQWTEADVQEARVFFSTYNAGHTPHAFPEDLFLRFIRDNDGYFPIRLRALPDGTVVHARTPQVVVEADAPYARLVTWFESMLLQTIWYMSTVATLSRLVRTDIAAAFDQSADDDARWKLGSRLHDFGLRGCTSIEQAIMGGAAHLLSSDGSDTCPAAYYAQFHCNDGRPVGSSIPATEHSVMTGARTEREAVDRVIAQFGGGVFATVADSYDYQRFLDELVPAVAPQVVSAGGFHVVRPDSGEPIQCVLDGLYALERAYGTRLNSKGYKVIDNASVIQGDGIDRFAVRDILAAVLDAGFSAENVAFGMGAGLLQKVNRDTCSYAMKLSHIVNLDGSERPIMKLPKTDVSKASFPGRFEVVRDAEGVPKTYPQGTSGGTGMLQVVYDGRPVDGAAFAPFDQVRARVEAEWATMPSKGSPISPALETARQAEIDRIRAVHG